VISILLLTWSKHRRYVSNAPNPPSGVRGVIRTPQDPADISIRWQEGDPDRSRSRLDIGANTEIKPGFPILKRATETKPQPLTQKLFDAVEAGGIGFLFAAYVSYDTVFPHISRRRMLVRGVGSKRGIREDHIVLRGTYRNNRSN